MLGRELYAVVGLAIRYGMARCSLVVSVRCKYIDTVRGEVEGSNLNLDRIEQRRAAADIRR
jgi:hypothetical protein